MVPNCFPLAGAMDPGRAARLRPMLAFSMGRPIGFH